MGQNQIQSSRVKNNQLPAEGEPTVLILPAEFLAEPLSEAALPLTTQQRRDQLIDRFSGKGLPSAREAREEFSRQLLDLPPVDRGYVITSAYFNSEVARNVIEHAQSQGLPDSKLLKEHDGKPIAALTESTDRPSIQVQKQIDAFSVELLALQPGERVQALFSRLHGAKVAGEVYEASKLFGDLNDKSLNPYHVMLANYLAGSISAKNEQVQSLDGRTIISAVAMLQEKVPNGHTEISWNVEDALRVKKSFQEADQKAAEGISNHYKRVEDKKERFKAVAAYFGTETAEYARSYNARDSLGAKIFTLGASDGERYLAKLVKKHPELEARTIRGAANCLDSGSIPLTDAERSEYAAKVALERKPKELVFGAHLNPENFDLNFKLEALQGRHLVMERAPVQPYDLRNRIQYPSLASEDPILPARSPALPESQSPELQLAGNGSAGRRAQSAAAKKAERPAEVPPPAEDAAIAIKPIAAKPAETGSVSSTAKTKIISLADAEKDHKAGRKEKQKNQRITQSRQLPPAENAETPAGQISPPQPPVETAQSRPAPVHPPKVEQPAAAAPPAEPSRPALAGSIVAEHVAPVQISSVSSAAIPPIDKPIVRMKARLDEVIFGYKK